MGLACSAPWVLSPKLYERKLIDVRIKHKTHAERPIPCHARDASQKDSEQTANHASKGKDRQQTKDKHKHTKTNDKQKASKHTGATKRTNKQQKARTSIASQLRRSAKGIKFKYAIQTLDVT